MTVPSRFRPIVRRSTAKPFIESAHFAIRLIRAFEFNLELNNYIRDDLDISLNLHTIRFLTNSNIFNEYTMKYLYLLIDKLEAFKSRIPDIKNSTDSLEIFINDIQATWCQTLGLNQNLICLTNYEIRALANYLCICELMIRCKESSVRVSREVWESIENAMVMPTPENES